MDRIEPSGERAGFYKRKCLQAGGKQEGQDDGQCDTHDGKVQKKRARIKIQPRF